MPRERQYNVFVENTWENYDIGSAYSADRKTLEKAVRRAAKAANSRLRRLEAARETRYAYRSAMTNLDGRKRFYEYTKNKTMAQLRREYGMLRDFISRPTSTLQGIYNTRTRRYMTAVERGFQGTEEDFYRLVSAYFTEEVESLFSSDIIYDTIVTGRRDIIDEILVRSQGERDRFSQGRALIQYLKASREKYGGVRRTH